MPRFWTAHRDTLTDSVCFAKRSKIYFAKRPKTAIPIPMIWYNVIHDFGVCRNKKEIKP